MRYFSVLVGVYGVAVVLAMVYFLPRVMPYVLGIISNFKDLM